MSELRKLIRAMKATLADDDFCIRPTEKDIALLASMLPEERNGECFCDEGRSSWHWHPTDSADALLPGCGNWERHVAEVGQPNDTYIPGYAMSVLDRLCCDECIGELCAGGIARRNADTKRVEVLRQLLTTGNDRWPAPSLHIMGQTAGDSMPMDEFRAAIDEVGARIEQGDQSP